MKIGMMENLNLSHNETEWVYAGIEDVSGSITSFNKEINVFKIFML